MKDNGSGSSITVSELGCKGKSARLKLLETEEECKVRQQQLLHEYEKRYRILPVYNERNRYI